jgi:DNA-binding IclR family transcriptional regulator
MAPSTLSSVQNALRILKELGREGEPLGVSDLSRRLELGKSTVHRLLSTLMSEAFVRQADDGRYALGITLWEIGSRVVDQLELREVAHPILEGLRNATGETVHLAILEGVEVVYIDRFESQATLTLFRRLGLRMPAHSTSTGKAILAFSSDEVVDRVVQAGLRKLARGTLTKEKAFRRALEEIRSKSYVVSIEESEPGVASIGAPVFDHRNQVVGAVSAAGPAQRFPPSKVPTIVRQVRKAANDISRAMGYTKTLGVVS